MEKTVKIGIDLNLNDRCPACKTALKNQLIDVEKNPDGTYRKILLQIDMFGIVCSKCGTHFTPASAIPALIEMTGQMEKAARSKIINPNQGAGKLFKPGGPPPGIDLKTGKPK